MSGCCKECEARYDGSHPTCQICGFHLGAGVFEDDTLDLKWVMAHVKIRGANGARAVPVLLLHGNDTPSTLLSPLSPPPPTPSK